jgi:hypothetical protein
MFFLLESGTESVAGPKDRLNLARRPFLTFNSRCVTSLVRWPRDQLMKKFAFIAGGLLVSFSLGALYTHLALTPTRAAERVDAPKKGVDPREQLELLRAEIKRIEALTPDQAAVMGRLAYHWSNLWFAIDQENWPLADFYLSETRSNLQWAIRVKPVRIINKEKVDLKSIGEALDNAPFTQMKEAIAKKDKAACVKIYDQALTGCYACHKASQKPFLRPQRPTAPEARVINFDPRATTPE